MADTILENLRTDRPGAAVCWLGNAGWLLAGRGRVAAFDLDLNSSELITPPALSAEQIAPWLDVLLITHPHRDHFNETTVGIFAKESRCRFVLPSNCLDKARALGIGDERIIVARKGRVVDLFGRDMTAEPTPAQHGDANRDAYRTEQSDCGYILTIGELRFFQPGDSLLMDYHLALRDIDAAFVSTTLHNMHIEPAAKFVHSLRPRYVFPQHFGTYVQTPKNAFWTQGHPDELYDALDEEMRRRYHKLRQAEVFVVEPPQPG